MITRIGMRNCATYSEIGAELDECKKVNFIYGANGSGKSTISNYLRDSSNPAYTDCILEWDNGNKEEILVYNRAFREANFSETDIDGVFTIGKASIEEQKKLEDMKVELVERKSEKGKTERTLAEKKCEKMNREETLKKDVWKYVFKANEKDFGEAFTGFKNSMERFYNETCRRYKVLSQDDYNKDELLRRASTLFGRRPELCNFIAIEIEEVDKEIKVIECNELWKKVIVGSEDVAIAPLIHRLQSNTWVSSGRGYIESESDICPFCQQPTITEEFRKQLDDFFDETYKEQVEKIEFLGTQYEDAIYRIQTQLNDLLENEDMLRVGEINLDLLSSNIELLLQLLNENKGVIDKKSKNPETKVVFKDYEEILKKISFTIQEANKKIEEHNKLVRDFQKSKEQLIHDIWEFVIKENQSLFDEANKQLEGIDKAIKGISIKVEQLKVEIDSLSYDIEVLGKNVTSVEPTVNEINRLLKAYGFTNFKIVSSKEKENSYQIQREDGSLATHTLSEGEETFITFLYFMQMRKGATDPSKVSSKKVLVLDDPICSLDSNVLYIVSAIVKDLARDIKEDKSDVSQLFILTHNVFFHKEASFIDGRTQENSDVNFWIISKDNNISSIKAYGMENPISTSYELLWKELRDNTSSSPITIQNIMRRILEHYFGILGKGRQAFIESKFESVEEQQVCTALFYWINDGSHTITDDLYIDLQTDAIERYKNVFHQIFIKTRNEAHYNMMMKKDHIEE